MTPGRITSLTSLTKPDSHYQKATGYKKKAGRECSNSRPTHHVDEAIHGVAGARESYPKPNDEVKGTQHGLWQGEEAHCLT